MPNMTMKDELKWRDEQIEGLKKKLYAHVDRIAELERLCSQLQHKVAFERPMIDLLVDRGLYGIDAKSLSEFLEQ